MSLPPTSFDAEERINVITHGLGALLGGVGLLVASGAIFQSGASVPLVSLFTYTASLVVLFGASAAYHGTRSPLLRRRLQKLDHCAIYGLIAGTYTPLMLIGLGGVWGWSIVGTVWLLAVLGISMELLLKRRWEKASLVLYVGMGWLALVAAVPLARALPMASLVLLVVGGVLYTGGVRYYTRNQPWDHAIWHGFVLGGAAAHGGAVVFCIA